MNNAAHALEELNAPPHSVQAEQAVLGSLLLDNGGFELVADKVSATDFYLRQHRPVYDAMHKLAANDQPIDVITVAETLEAINELEDIGGLPFIRNLADSTPPTSNIAAYAKIVREKSVTRQLISVGNNIAQSGYRQDGQNISELLDSAESQVFQIADQQQQRSGGFSPMTALLTKTINKVQERYESDNALTGVSTGFNELDEKTTGLQPANLIIVAGRPSMGKTSFAMNLAENVAIIEKKPVAVFSMEMPDEDLTMRMVSSQGRVNLQSIRTGQIEDEEWPRITNAVSILNNANIHIDDTPALTTMELRARCRRLAKECKQPLGLVVIDYIQLMQSSESGENRATEMSTISRNLKALAKELNTPVVALSQLNRSLEQRPNKRPIMSDLRESGAIEQDADTIMFVYRDEVYNQDSPDQGKAEIIIGKQRNGPIGRVYLSFQGQFTRFDNLANDYYQDEY